MSNPFEDMPDEDFDFVDPLRQGGVLNDPFEDPFDHTCDQLDALNEPMKSLDERAYARPDDETVGERLEYAIRLLSVHGLIRKGTKEYALELLDYMRGESC